MAFPCPGRSAARRLFAAWCAAEPGPYQAPVSGTVPVLRSGMKNAASRPGHVIAFLIQISNGHFIRHSGARAFARTQNPEVLNLRA